ncbi:DUF58 domain-containing protein [Brachybacterium huguangmaarense]|uniref:DUF58 domain-containing protein n=1 Tax=Brachybacterium huguangmaarense TaxID=1652028 RepID=A0ABY6FZ97_9MICO|nr:DUF58 domain-containing protein [Brachybacterium huguangmaarense]UYG15706.1 DUF58 domain-containing protein [Brachybacterium huguangmaarense]
MRIWPTPRAALVALVGVLPLVVAPSWITVLVCLAVLLVLVLGDALAAVPPRSLRLRRDMAAQVRLGGAVDARLLITNPSSRRARLLVRDAWDPTAGLAEQRARITVPAGERRAISQRYVPVRRGAHASRTVAIAAIGPLGLARRCADLDVRGALMALHPFGSRRHLPSRVRRLREIEGLAAVHQRGEGTEFDALRDFVDGDDVRSIDWRATARRRSVVVRTWRPERDRHVLIVVDTSRTAAARLGDAPRLDAAFDAALLLTALATQAGDRVDVLCIDRIPHVSVTGSSVRTVLHDVVAATAPVHPALVETDWELAAAQIRRRTRKGALVVLVTPVEPGTVHQGLVPVAARLAAEHPLVIASVADPALAAMAHERGDAGAVYRAAAAEHARAERTAVGEALTRGGAHVIDDVPDALPQALADGYLALKAAGRL